jgi:hypothetical protein
MNPQRFRYWVARLRPIAKPRVWLPVIGGAMVGGFGWVAYQNPEHLSFIGGGEGTGDAESASIGADIDSVSLLMQEMGDPSNTSTNAPTPDGSKSKATILNPGSPAPSDTVQSENDRSRPLTGGSISQFALFTTGNPNGATGAQNNQSNMVQNALFVRSETVTTRTNPLAQAIDRLTGQPRTDQTSNPAPIEGSGLIENRSLWNGVPADGSAGLNTPTPPIVPGGSRPIGTGYGNSGYGNSGYGNNYGNNAYTNLTGASAGYAVPDSGVATPIAPSSGYNAGNLNSGVAMPMPIPYSGLGASEPYTVPVEQVFTAPRLIPGRPIGAGNINTFSNP